MVVGTPACVREVYDELLSRSGADELRPLGEDEGRPFGHAVGRERVQTHPVGVDDREQAGVGAERQPVLATQPDAGGARPRGS